jgi:hypothetical protein
VVKFKSSALVSTIPGPRFADDARSRLSKMLKGAAYENIFIRQARLSSNTFLAETEETKK